MKHSDRYLKGFREGFNNPKQNMNINLNHPKANDDLIKGIIAGVCKRTQRIYEGKNYFIWNDEDLFKEVD